MEHPSTFTPERLIELEADLRIWCDGCKRAHVIEPAALIIAGRGGRPIAKMRFSCTTCAELGRESRTAAKASWRIPAGGLIYNFATGEYGPAHS